MEEMKYLSKYNYLNSVCANVKASAGGETVWLFVCKACALLKHVCLPMSVEGTGRSLSYWFKNNYRQTGCHNDLKKFRFNKL